MKPTHITWALFALVSFGLQACNGGGASGAPGATARFGPGSSSELHLVRVSNGSGDLLPHTAFELDASGNPTNVVVPLRSIEDLLANVRPHNPVRPVATFTGTATLPNGAGGNQFLAAEFTRPLEVDSILDPDPAAAAVSGLIGSIQVLALDPASGAATPVQGRAFMGGQTYSGVPVGGLLPLERWVEVVAGRLEAAAGIDGDGNGIPDGLGFPGTQSDFAGAVDLLSPDTFVFVVDSDGDLATHETFPAGRQLRLAITTDVHAQSGAELVEPAVACTTVGADTLAPEPVLARAPALTLRTDPENGSVDVDPLTNIRLGFTEAIQPTSLGDLPLGSAPAPSPALAVEFGPPATRVQVPVHVLPVSPYDLTSYELIPAFSFPGGNASGFACAALDEITVTLFAGEAEDLTGNTNILSADSSFTTGEGPGLVNAPVAPDTIYVGRSGARTGLSVIDLNGFGGSTGDPSFDPTFQTILEHGTKYPFNPNVSLQGTSLIPPLAPGTCTIDGGSAGVFTLTKDSSLDDLLVRSPVMQSVGDMMLGHALDSTYNNGPAPFGCQAGGGNLCALGGFKIMELIQGGPNTVTPPILSNPILAVHIGSENIVSWAPHPNPPPLQFPPLCLSPFIGGQEPTSIESAALSLNLLVPGDPLGDPAQGIPPSGLLSAEQNTWFQGPSQPALNPAACANFMVRQQVGHYLYVIDRGAREVVVLNSNRMTVVDRLGLPDPTELALATNLDFLAVTNQAADTVSFIDLNPSSATFHEVVQEVAVGDAPRGIAWDGGNEDVLVCNEGDDSVSIISTFSLQVRKTVTRLLDRPFQVVITPRQQNFGYNRRVYFAYVMNRNGKLAVFESGPDAVNGWGYDDVIGLARPWFQAPKAMQLDPRSLNSSVWVAHEGRIDLSAGTIGPLGEPALTRVEVESGVFGPLPLSGTQPTPQFRDMSIVVKVSLGSAVVSGVPVDLAFDNLRNYGGLPNFATSFSAGLPARLNGKAPVRMVGNTIQNTSESDYLFVAVPNPLGGPGGVVDVIDVGAGYARTDTNAFHDGIQSIPVEGAAKLMDYFRQ